ncbi:hypothetical protein B0F90DRAFT_1742926 [Multifurca ochricompacta]|uniref:Uncharacterized protein n=1 Tax=Multifurca ochricompacta TaxID=376703 RepID=A0AAD4M0E6_9AGAM|nr:hypothetical protein B0F90DRAFT_1742926 [Multifurca ochricompacta]
MILITITLWSAIQARLHLLESLRSLRERFSVFESQLRGTLLTLAFHCVPLSHPKSTCKLAGHDTGRAATPFGVNAQ